MSSIFPWKTLQPLWVRGSAGQTGGASEELAAEPEPWYPGPEESISFKGCEPTASRLHNPQKCLVWHMKSLTEVKIICQYLKNPERFHILKTQEKMKKSGHPKPIFPPCHTWLELPPLEVACYPQFTTVPTIPCSLSSIQPEGLFNLSLSLYCIVSFIRLEEDFPITFKVHVYVPVCAG